MKKACIYLAFILFLYSSGIACANSEKSWQTFDKSSLALEKAIENIFGNLDLLASMRGDFGESALLAWATPIADKIPSQPAAVIRLMARTGYPVKNMCPRMYIEDQATFDEMVQWMEQAVAALDSFAMKDPKEEALREACLREIRKTLANRESWRFPK